MVRGQPVFNGLCAIRGWIFSFLTPAALFGNPDLGWNGRSVLSGFACLAGGKLKRADCDGAPANRGSQRWVDGGCLCANPRNVQNRRPVIRAAYV